ncbi:protein FAM110C [Dipodomys spectabilis]|uniref:protein FAM110C n=1 Tax=Dipodomys spectabilis TaxID=105255 RepID=UPI001C538234|nr:protein FAM110C [Dipodomys spectabilis]
MRALPAAGEPHGPRPPPRDAGGTLRSPPARPARGSAVERLAADRAKFAPGAHAPGGAPAPEARRPGAASGRLSAAPAPRTPPAAPAPVARRAVARKPLRPDSLVIYRQRCAFVRGAGAGADSAGGLVKKLLRGPGRDAARGPPETARPARPAPPAPPTPAPAPPAPPAPAPAPPTPARAPAPSTPARAPAPSLPARAPAPPAPAGAPAPLPAPLPAPERQAAKRRDLQRSQSDLGSSAPAPAAAGRDADAFFRFCGLDPEVVEALGRENFSAGSDHAAPGARVVSVSLAASDSGSSRRSEAGPPAEELPAPPPRAPSVVERNARIIKWLYTCRRAKEAPGQRLQGPS